MAEMEGIKKKCKVLVVGGTGYLGRRIVRASLAEGHPTFVLHRPEIGIDVEKVQMLLSFKNKGARLLPGSFDDHRSLVDAVSQVDVVISAVSGAHHRSHEILIQLKLVAAIKEAGNVKRFLPSEFGTDPGRMGHALPPGRVTFDEKMEVRRAIEEANIPFTYVSANCFMGYFVGGLCQLGTLIPPTDHVSLHGDGSVKSIFVDEDDIALYTIKTIDDPRALNKTVYIRPPDNILSQMEVVKAWEDLIGKELHKTSISESELFANFEGMQSILFVGQN
ncbi:hypothetical protein KSP40_PGU016937 [Platanthera guangdongensis]|uniref:NmrA-like domain-containing protein n=1 Tax=Platanthera guangdongensis TaxID=2320717 RepID=A0ABR2LRQ3_9ASPA